MTTRIRYRGLGFGGLSTMASCSEDVDDANRELVGVMLASIGLKTNLIINETKLHEKKVRRIIKAQGLRGRQGKTKSFEGFCRDPSVMMEGAVLLRAYIQAGGPQTKETVIPQIFFLAYTFLQERNSQELVLDPNDAYKIVSHYRQSIIRLTNCRRCSFEHIEYVRTDGTTPAIGCPICEIESRQQAPKKASA